MIENKITQQGDGEGELEELLCCLSTREVCWLPKLLDMEETKLGVWLGRVEEGEHLGRAVGQIKNGLVGDLTEVRGKLAKIGGEVQRRAAAVHVEQVEAVIWRWLLDGEGGPVRRWLEEGGDEGEGKTEREIQLLRRCVKCFPLGPVHLGKYKGEMGGRIGSVCTMDGGILEVLFGRLGLFVLAFSLNRADYRHTGAMVAALPEEDHQYLMQVSNLLGGLDESMQRGLRMLTRLILLNAGVYQRDYMGAFLKRIGVCLVAVAHFGRFDFEAQFLAARVPPADGLAALQCVVFGSRISGEVLQWLQNVLLKMAANPLLLLQLSHLQGVFEAQKIEP